MSLFGNLKSDGLEEAQDRLGGGSKAKESGIYKGVIKALYAGKSSRGATSVSLIAQLEDGTEYRETFYVTNAKGENWFLNKDDKTKKVPLPGFTVVDDICLIATEKPLAEQDTEDKMINIYNFDEKKEIPTSVPMIVEALGKTVAFGIIKQTVNKNVKNDATGEYEPTAETRDENFTDKVFEPETMVTIVEAKAGITEGKFHEGWAERNNGVTRDKRALKDGQTGAPPKPGQAPAANAGGAPKKSLFGKKSA